MKWLFPQNCWNTLADGLYKNSLTNSPVLKLSLIHISNQTVNLEASNRSTAVTPKSIIGGNKAPSFLQAPAVQDLDPHLNPNYNFENFIEGYSNKLSKMCIRDSHKCVPKKSH